VERLGRWLCQTILTINQYHASIDQDFSLKDKLLSSFLTTMHEQSENKQALTLNYVIEHAAQRRFMVNRLYTVGHCYQKVLSWVAQADQKFYQDMLKAIGFAQFFSDLISVQYGNLERYIRTKTEALHVMEV